MVRARHLEIQKIERDFMELAQMFTDLEQLVVQQDAPITQIDEQGEQVATDVVKANEEIKGAIDKARARNRKKWWCLLICRKCCPVQPPLFFGLLLTCSMQS
jgi:syntaxin 1B/2/3